MSDNSRTDPAAQQGPSKSPAATKQEKTVLNDTPSALAERLLAAGIPVVVCRPCPGYGKPGRCTRPGHDKGTVELHQPKGWPTVDSEDCDLSGFRPGVDTLAMVSGHGIDLVDVDTKAGGSVGHLPPFVSYGMTRTPSGGEHYVVPSSGLGKVSPLDTLIGHVGDYVGGKPDGSSRLLGYLPGSSRPKYPGGSYVEEEPWDIDTCLAAQPDPSLVAALEEAGATSTVREEYPADVGPLRPVEQGVHPEATKVVARALERLDCLPAAWSDGDHWDHEHHKAASILQRVANSNWSGYTREQAEADYLAHARTDEGWGEDMVELKWKAAEDTVQGGGWVPPYQEFLDEPLPPLVRRLPSTWTGMDLTGYLDGTHKPVQPEFLLRDDGVALLYPGLTHSIHGESESGKSMVAQWECVQRLRAGQAVLYLDFESDPSGIVERLRLLGADMRVVAERFVYLQPASDPHRSKADNAAFLATLDAHPYSLAVIDGVSESMDALGLDVKDANASAIEWARKLPRFVADRTGAAVVQIDHVTKSADTRGRFAIGGQAKMSALTGAAYALDVIEPIGRGLRGKLGLRVAKDRPGYVRGKSGASASDRTQEAATVIVDSTGGWLEFHVLAPAPVDTPDDKLEVVKHRIAEVLDALPDDHPGLTTNTLKTEAHSNNVLFPRALDALVAGGYVTRTQVGQRKYHRLARPYAPEFEP